ncbi:MAG: hypothetical protein D3923_14740, partial [Candidatus Electrothrix sp. AR3]|nr:hypothetical protein [Candidatus Electrothrix sp. AR3]
VWFGCESGPDIINFQEEDKNWIKITAGNSTYKLAGMISEEFPQFEQYVEKSLVEIERGSLRFDRQNNFFHCCG